VRAIIKELEIEANFVLKVNYLYLKELSQKFSQNKKVSTSDGNSDSDKLFFDCSFDAHTRLYEHFRSE
jgi:hypothetical protein